MLGNLLGTISQFLTPEVVRRIADAAGLDSPGTRRLVRDSVPILLGCLTDLASSPQGANRLVGAIEQQPIRLLENVAAAQAPSDATTSELIDSGRNLLSSMFGADAFASLTSTVSNYFGAGEAPTRNVLGLVTPIVLSFLGRAQRDGDLDASGLARMLQSQTAQFTAAMPPGLSGMLKSLGIRQRRLSVAQPADTAEPPPKSADGSWKGIYWAIPLLALLGIAWYLLSGEETTDRNTVPLTKTMQSSLPQRNPARPVGFLASGSATMRAIGAYHPIYNAEGEKIGTVTEILISPDDKLTAAVVSVDRILGLGEKIVAVPFSAIRVSPRQSGWYLYVDTAKDALNAAPVYKAAPIPYFGSPTDK